MNKFKIEILGFAHITHFALSLTEIAEDSDYDVTVDVHVTPETNEFTVTVREDHDECSDEDKKEIIDIVTKSLKSGEIQLPKFASYDPFCVLTLEDHEIYDFVTPLEEQ